MDLIEFLRARLDDDEVDANALAHELGKWLHEFEVNGMDKSEGSYIAYMLVRGHASNPARVLAEVSAKRARLELHQPVPLRNTHPDWYVGTDAMECSTCHQGHFAEAWPCRTIRTDVVAYAEHPDFDPAWLSR